MYMDVEEALAAKRGIAFGQKFKQGLPLGLKLPNGIVIGEAAA
jgi:salicylate hydroxylase